MNASTVFFRDQRRRLSALAAAIFGILIVGRTFAQGTIRREATVEAVRDDAAVKTAVFVIEEKTKEKNAKPVKWVLAVEKSRLFQQLPGGRRVHVAFSALKPGQCVQVTAATPFGITGYNLATQVIILPPKSRK